MLGCAESRRIKLNKRKQFCSHKKCNLVRENAFTHTSTEGIPASMSCGRNH